MDPSYEGHVIVCGLHELGLSIVEQFHFAGAPVVVVDDDPDRRLLPTLEIWSVPFVAGSPRSPEVLANAGAMRAIAIVCVEDNDLHTLETALVARTLRPELRIVMQMTNAAVARAVTQITGPRSALDVADLASPSIVHACLGQRQHHVTIRNQDFATIEVTVPRGGTIRSLYGDLVPLAVVPESGQDVDICPGRDRMVSAGDRVTLFGVPADMAGIPGRPPDEELTRPRRGPLERVVAFHRFFWVRTDWPFRLTLLGLVVLVVASAFVIRAGYQGARGTHMSYLTSLYFTVETVATVGYGDYNFYGQPAWLKVFGIVLIIAGVALVTTMFALFTNLLVARSVAQALGAERVVRMHHHVVIVGLGAVGSRVVQTLLADGIPVVIIERSEENRNLSQARRWKVPVVIGDATLPATLEAANVRSASAVAALTSDDLTNFETALSLRDALASADNPAPVVIRVFDRSLAQVIERDFGFAFVRSTSALSAPWFVGAALGIEILGTFYVEQERLLVARLTVAPAGGLAGLQMQDLSARIRVIAIQRAGGDEYLEHPPRRNTRFAPGDQAYLIGPYENLLAVLRRDAEQPVDERPAPTGPFHPAEPAADPMARDLSQG